MHEYQESDIETKQEYMNEAEVQEFSQQAKFAITAENTYPRCVDGRYAGEHIGAAAEAGGAAGMLEKVFAAANELKLDATPGQLHSIVIEYLGGPEHFHFHTDEHATSEGKPVGMGCGHIKHSTNDPSAYNITAEQGAFLKQKLEELKRIGAPETNLHGNHEESAVIIVESDDFSMRPMIGQDGTTKQAFIFHKTLAERSMHDLAARLHAQFPNHTEDELFGALSRAQDLQLGETVKRLAPTLPQYLVHINPAGEVAVTTIKTAEKSFAAQN